MVVRQKFGMKAVHTALEIAQYLLWRVAQENPDDPTYLTPLQLQKLLYYVQGWYAAETGGMPAFQDEVQAWRYGPVVPSVYQAFKHLDRKPITDPPAQPPDLTPAVRGMVEAVWDRYKDYSPGKLADMTHEEMPWKKARGDLPPSASSEKSMPLADLQAEFTAQFERAQQRLVAHAKQVRAMARRSHGSRPVSQ